MKPHDPDSVELAESQTPEGEDEGAAALTPEEVETRRRFVLTGLAQTLGFEFEDRKNKRRQIETRWLEDLRQYNGLYDPETLAKIQENKGSEAFVNITRPKADSVEARITDVLIPTTDRAFEVSHTTMPEMGKLENVENVVDTTPQGNPVQARDYAAGVRDEARERAMKMRDTIDDQLEECRYNNEVRKAVHDSVVLGMGILKGPVVRNVLKRKWQTVRDEGTGATAQVAELVEDRRPMARRVNPWQFYPQPGITNIRESESEFEVHYLTAQQLRELAKQPGFDKDVIRRRLEGGKAPSITEQWRLQLRSISGEEGSLDVGYELIEYTGPVTTEELIAAGVPVKDDTLESYPANIWFFGGEVYKADLLLMELPDQKVYKVWNWAKDDSTIAGRGVPRQMRVSQAAINAVFRMMMDNSGLAIGGQLVYDAVAVVPADGNPRMTPRKSWQFTQEGSEAGRSVRDVFNIVEIPLRLEWLIPLFNLCMRIADEESQLPLIAQGDQAPHITKTKGGMSMLMDAAGVQLRASVRSFDEDMTVPMIGDFYAWNMLFNPDEEIKGDFNVVARGASVLYERETQMQALMGFVQLFKSDPRLDACVEWGNVGEEATRLLRMNRNSFLKSPEKMKAIFDQYEKNPPQPPPDPRIEVETIRDKRERDLTNAKNALTKAMADDKNAILIDQIALEAGLSRDEFLTTMGLDKARLDSENQRFNTEVALKTRLGMSGV